MENQTGRLYRSSSAKVIAGVCAGLAKHFKMDPTLVRLIFVFLAVFALGGVIAYVVLWIVLPEAPIDNLGFNSESTTDESVLSETVAKGKGQLVIGLTLISIGALFLITAFIPRFSVLDLWPVVLIAVGILLLQQSSKNS
ncbi:MAG: PspC domain-containing protein [Bacteroidales bacterium]|mgnify:CR=1 FL=1|nr:PspC domain-containing protein [Bacteroidales bacterium]MDD4085842.1 PspC domain-containing protein [Bacteroidales bacterium]